MKYWYKMKIKKSKSLKKCLEIDYPDKQATERLIKHDSNQKLTNIPNLQTFQLIFT